MPLPSGISMGRYRILSLLGVGGMGEVYLAEDTQLRRKLAIKLLPADFAADTERLARFKREAVATSSLNHPNILTIYEIGKESDHYFLATEFVEGESLRQRLLRSRINLSEVLEIGIQLTSALAAAHAAQIVHRDIKPENIMLRPDHIVKMLDFGLAKFVQEEGHRLDTEAPTKPSHDTKAGVVMGTVAYMSPEQARGLRVDLRTDLWSLGCVLYEMATRRLPFSGQTTMDVITAILHEEPPPLMRYTREIPVELERIIGKALRKEPGERYQVAEDLAEDLKNLRRRLEFKTEVGHSASPESPESVQNSHVSSAPSNGQTLKKVSAASGANRDTLLLTEFTNLTNDTVFDGTLKTALAVALEQSPFLSIFAEARVRQTLCLMGHSPDERVTHELGREICQRQGLKAYIAGTIASFGTMYVLTLEAVNARTSETLGRQLEQAESKEQVLKALGRAASSLREKLGESLSSIEQFDVPLEEATTPSLEALQVYSLGVEHGYKGKLHEAISFYKRAIELDPNFASAYGILATNYDNTNQPKLAAECATRAFELSDRVSELEKLRIAFFYYASVTGEMDKRIETLELYKRTYPRDSRAFVNLSGSYLLSGQFEKAVAAAHEAIRLNPNNAYGYLNLAQALISLNRFPEAREVCERAFEQKMESTYFHVYLYQIAFIADDTAAMRKHLAEINGQSNEYIALDLQTCTAAYRGQWRSSQDLSRRAIDLAGGSDAREAAAQYAAEQALRVVFWSSASGLPSGDDDRVKLALKAHTRQALRLERNKVTLSRASFALGLAGQTHAAYTLIRELEAECPKDTLINHLWLPLAKAALSLQSGNAEDAIELLKTTTRFERAAEFYPQYLRGLSYLRMCKGKAATQEFQKIIAHRGEAPMSALYPLAHLGTARALTSSGERDLSLKSYEEFLGLWKNADIDMPLLIAAKSEYEQLKS